MSQLMVSISEISVWYFLGFPLWEHTEYPFAVLKTPILIPECIDIMFSSSDSCKDHQLSH